MSPLGSGKKIGLAVGLVAVLAVVGFGVIRRIESTVTENVHSLLAASKGASIQAEDVSYSLFRNTLALKDLKLSFTARDGTRQNLTAASLDLEGVNRSLSEALNNAADIPVMADVADLARLRDFTVVAEDPNNGQAVTATGKNVSVTDLRLDTAFLARCLEAETPSETLPLKVSHAIAYAEGRSENIEMTVSGRELPAPAQINVESAVSRGYDRGSMRENTINGIRMRMGDRERASLGKFRLADVTLPSYETMLAADTLNAEQLSDDELLKRSLDLFRSVFLGEKPLVGSMELTDLHFPESGVSLKNLTLRNTSTRPFDASLAVNGLILPLTISPYTAQLGLLGYKRLDISQLFNLSIPVEGGSLTFSTELDAENMLKGTFALQGELPGGDLDPEQRWTAFKVTLLDASWTDEGLLPRAAASNRRLTGMTPAATLQSLENRLQSELAGVALQPAEQALIRELTAKIMAFVGRPGTLRVVFKPERPMTLEELERLPDISAFAVTVQEGAQTLEERVQAVLNDSEENPVSR